VKVPDNKVKSVLQNLRSELSDTYDGGELRSILNWAFLHKMGFSATDLVTRAEERLSESEIVWFIQLKKALKQQQPIQYILGETEFCGLTFKSDKRALIPRPETEELVGWIVERTQQMGRQNGSILDIGTGSGCIALALKQLLPQAQLTGMDISKEALALASENGVQLNLDVHWLEQDILATEAEQDNMIYDIIVSNPPYVRHSERALMSANVLEFEPHQALFVYDDDALLYYREIAHFAKKHLSANGALFFEINEALGKELVDLLTALNFKNIELKKDIYQKDRMLCCIPG